MKFPESQCLVEILSDGLKRGIESGLGGEVGDADEIAFGAGAGSAATAGAATGAGAAGAVS